MTGNSMDLGAFLGHKTRDAGGGTNFLKNWKKRTPPRIDTWMHTRAPFIALWQHNIPRLVEIGKDGNKQVKVWGGSFNCYEHEDVLKKQYKRDRDTGARKAPPVVCPQCLLIEAIRMSVKRNEVSWVEPLFRFEGDDPRDTVVIHAGGIYNAFSDDNLSDQEHQEMSDAGIYPKSAWKENTYPKCNYVFCVVDNDNPDDGIQVTTETTLLGDKVKEVIRDAMEATSEEDGNPLKNPYCIRWDHRKNEVMFQNKYKAIKMDRIDLSPEVEKLIVETDPPDMDAIIKVGNPITLRTALEDAYVGPRDLIDFDRIFEASERLWEERGETPRENSPVPKTRSRAEPSEPDPDPLPEHVEEAEIVDCDECGKPISMDDAICPHCGFVYEENVPEPEPEPPPPPPVRKRRSRSEAKPKKATTAKAAAPPAPPAEPDVVGLDDDPDGLPWVD